MGNRLNVALAALFLLFHLIQGIPLDSMSPVEPGVLEKRQPPPPPPNVCREDAHAAAKHYHIHYCQPLPGYKTTLRAQCLSNEKVRVYCGVPIVGVQEFVDIPCFSDEFCLPDEGKNCVGYEGQKMDACVKDLIPGNIDPLGVCYGTRDIAIPQTGAVLLHARTSGIHGYWTDKKSGQSADDKSYFDELLNGPTTALLKVVVACGVRVAYSVFSI